MFGRIRTKKEYTEILIKNTLHKLNKINLKESYLNDFKDLTREDVSGLYLFLINHQDFKINEEKIKNYIQKKDFNRADIFKKSLIVKKRNFLVNYFNIQLTFEETSDFELKLMFKYINGN